MHSVHLPPYPVFGTSVPQRAFRYVLILPSFGPWGDEDDDRFVCAVPRETNVVFDHRSIQAFNGRRARNPEQRPSRIPEGPMFHARLARLMSEEKWGENTNGQSICFTNPEVILVGHNERML